MNVLDVIARALDLTAGRTAMAEAVYDALDAAGYLVEPDRPLYIELDSRVCTHVTDPADGVRLEWNNDTVVGIEIRDGLAVMAP